MSAGYPYRKGERVIVTFRGQEKQGVVVGFKSDRTGLWIILDGLRSRACYHKSFCRPILGDM